MSVVVNLTAEASKRLDGFKSMLRGLNKNWRLPGYAHRSNDQSVKEQLQKRMNCRRTFDRRLSSKMDYVQRVEELEREIELLERTLFRWRRRAARLWEAFFYLLNYRKGYREMSERLEPWREKENALLNHALEAIKMIEAHKTKKETPSQEIGTIGQPGKVLQFRAMPSKPDKKLDAMINTLIIDAGAMPPAVKRKRGRPRKNGIF